MTYIDHTQNTKRIARNAIFLYIRMMIMMVVSLVTFRELLKQLGVDDYGTYNAVAGIIILFSFLSNALTQSNQRFLSFHIGRGNMIDLKHTFSMIINIQLILVCMILILAETVGAWFINSKMNFANENMIVINRVYQFSIFTFIIQFVRIPYTSAIIAHEKMSFFSYISIGEALLKLSVVYSLSFFSDGRLLLYAALLTVSSIIVFLSYFIYCIHNFKSCRYQFKWSNKMFKEILSFSSWNLIGGIGVVGTNQGINILFNIFCGVLVNAAMGISQQVTSAVSSLVSNIQMAFNPQIIKSYATNDIQFFRSLIIRASRISFFLIMLVGLPVIICTEPLLELWLDDVPYYAVSFTQLSILYCMIDSISIAIWVGVQASGNIKWYTIILTTVIVLNLPIGYIVLKIGLSPNFVLAIRALIAFIIHIIRIYYLGHISDFSAKDFFMQVTLRSVLFFILCTPIPIALKEYFSEGFDFIILGGITFAEVAILGTFILLTENERLFLKEKINSLKF